MSFNFSNAAPLKQMLPHPCNTLTFLRCVFFCSVHSVRPTGSCSDILPNEPRLLPTTPSIVSWGDFKMSKVDIYSSTMRLGYKMSSSNTMIMSSLSISRPDSIRPSTLVAGPESTQWFTRTLSDAELRDKDMLFDLNLLYLSQTFTTTKFGGTVCECKSLSTAESAENMLGGVVVKDTITIALPPAF